MISEEEAAQHASLAPEQRFYFAERAARDRLRHDGYDNHDYMIEVLAAAEAFGIDELSSRWQLPSYGDEGFWPTCNDFLAHSRKVSTALMYRFAGVGQRDPNTVALDAATKEKLRFHIGQVRGIIDKEPLPTWKKEEFYDALAHLEREFDKARTPLAAVLDVVAKAADGSTAIFEALRKIITIVCEAKSVEREKAKLAAPAEPKGIETERPKKLLAGPKPRKNGGFEKALDEEIPF